jgi:hypothetical protein
MPLHGTHLTPLHMLIQNLFATRCINPASTTYATPACPTTTSTPYAGSERAFLLHGALSCASSQLKFDACSPPAISHNA